MTDDEKDEMRLLVVFRKSMHRRKVVEGKEQEDKGPLEERQDVNDLSIATF